MNGVDELRALVTTALPRAWAYLRTWQRSDGLFSGLIATWWSSTVETAAPHPMNQFPMIIGLTRLSQAGIQGGDWLTEARRVGDGLVASIAPGGSLANDYADIPPRTASPIFYSSCVRGLCALHIACGDNRYLNAAQKLDAFLTRRWARGDELVGCPVSNQELSWAWSKLWLGRATGDKSLIEQARRIARRTLPHQIRSGAMAGGVCQGRFDDRLIAVYVAKCVEPFWEIANETNDQELRDAALRGADFMLRQEVEPGIWLNYHGPCGAAYGVARQFSRLDNRVFRQRFPLYKARRPFIRWQTTRYPSWMARSGDGIRALWRLGSETPRFRENAIRLAKQLITAQHPNGGFPNTVGYFGDPQRVDWQDAAPCTRWNTYVFLLMCQLAIDLGVKEIATTAGPGEWGCDLHGERRLHESPKSVELLASGKLAWRVDKSTGMPEVVTPEWRGDLSGHRGKPETRNA